MLKLRQCNGYLTMFSDESGLRLSPALATGGCTDAAKHVDLPLFLNAAHGGLFSWSNRPDRERALKAAAAPPCPSEAVPEAVSLTLAHTNVHFVLIGQEDVFAKFWAQLAHAKQIGLAQRFLLSFGARQCTACTKWNAFFQSVTLPILEQLFTIVLHRVGPHTPEPPENFELTAQQEEEVDNLGQIRALFEGRESARKVFRQAMPKTMYWFGTSRPRSCVACSGARAPKGEGRPYTHNPEASAWQPW